MEMHVKILMRHLLSIARSRRHILTLQRRNQHKATSRTKTLSSTWLTAQYRREWYDSNKHIAADTSPPIISVQSLAHDFEQLSVSDQHEMVNAYNHALPYVYEYADLCAHIRDDEISHIFSYDNLQSRENLFERAAGIAKIRIEQMKRGVKHEHEETLEQQEDLDDEKEWTPCHNGILRKFRGTDRTTYLSHQAVLSMQLGSPIIVDCDYDEHMKNRELPSLNRQLLQMYEMNSKLQDPYDFHLCNVTENSYVKKPTKRNLSLENCLIKETSKSPTEIFDRRKLVQLSPDAPLFMEKYDPQAIYIIGGYVDLANAEDLSFQKSQEMGIEARQFPLDIYIDWPAASSKRLLLTEVLSILIYLRERPDDWEGAIKSALPKRILGRLDEKILDTKERSAEMQLTQKKYIEDFHKRKDQALRKRNEARSKRREQWMYSM